MILTINFAKISALMKLPGRLSFSNLHEVSNGRKMPTNRDISMVARKFPETFSKTKQQYMNHGRNSNFTAQSCKKLFH